MKLAPAIALFALTLFAPAAFAAGSYSCREIKPKYGPATLSFQLKKIGVSAPAEGNFIRYTLEISERGAVIFRAPAVATTEDVMLHFAVKGQRVYGTIFMDELDQTSLTLQGKNYRFNCGE